MLKDTNRDKKITNIIVAVLISINEVIIAIDGDDFIH